MEAEWRKDLAQVQELRAAEEEVEATWSNYLLACAGQDPRAGDDPSALYEGFKAYLHQRLLAAALAHCQARQRLESLQNT